MGMEELVDFYKECNVDEVLFGVNEGSGLLRGVQCGCMEWSAFMNCGGGGG